MGQNRKHKVDKRRNKRQKRSHRHGAVDSPDRLFRQLEKLESPLDLELIASTLLTALYIGSPDPEDDLPDVHEGAIALEVAFANASSGSLALLHTVAVLGENTELGDAAASLAQALRERGIAEPTILSEVGSAAPTSAIALRDAYGDSETIFIEFSYPSNTHVHTFGVLIDHCLRGISRDVHVLNDTLESVVRGWRQAFEDNPFGKYTHEELLSPAEAANRISDAITNLDAVDGSVLHKLAGEDLFSTIALAAHRAEQLEDG